MGAPGLATSCRTAPRFFVDTNVFVYAADESPEEQHKHEVASALLVTDPDDLVISTQVLQEFYVAVTRKLRIPLPEERAASAVRGMAKLEVVQVDVSLVLTAVDTSRVVGIRQPYRRRPRTGQRGAPLGG
ncbi:MAG: PIN domain-containing protein [Pseudonocardiaceae bacterium]